MADNSKVVSARLTEDELATLNTFMQKHYCKNLADLLKLVIGGKIELSSIAGDIAEIKSTLFTIVDSLRIGETDDHNSCEIARMRWPGNSSSFLPFEPGSTAWQAAVLDQARRPPLTALSKTE